MILAHEIPKGSRLYFGVNASLKRTIEQKACEVLQNHGFSEIVTPHFAYHEHQLREDEAEAARLIRIATPDNAYLTLRADSSLDVVRLITKRLGKAHSKWFYVQPIFLYPSSEFYQIGAEWIDSCDVKEILKTMQEIFAKISIQPIIQLSSTKITDAVCRILNIKHDILSPLNVMQLDALGVNWLSKLVRITNLSDIDIGAPDEIMQILNDMQAIANEFQNSEFVLHPLYVSENDYYNGTFFRVLCNNTVIAQGGAYKSESVDCVGFALYTDNILGITHE